MDSKILPRFKRRETHRQQTDLEEIGFGFAFVYLPSANALWYGLLLSVVMGGGALATAYLQEVYETTVWILERVSAGRGGL